METSLYHRKKSQLYFLLTFSYISQFTRCLVLWVKQMQSWPKVNLKPMTSSWQTHVSGWGVILDEKPYMWIIHYWHNFCPHLFFSQKVRRIKKKKKKISFKKIFLPLMMFFNRCGIVAVAKILSPQCAVELVPIHCEYFCRLPWLWRETEWTLIVIVFDCICFHLWRSTDK